MTAAKRNGPDRAGHPRRRVIHHADPDCIRVDLDAFVIEHRDPDRQEVDAYQAARYRVTTVTPAIPTTRLTIYQLSQSDLECFLEHYQEFAEFLVSVEIVEGDT